jgi:NADH-quinone oxidoreductase subunit E
MFRLHPPGKHVISVCHNISCDLRGAREILAQVCERTGAAVHGTSSDGKFSVETVECQGACANAPMFDLDGVYHEDLDAKKVDEILGRLA